MTKPIYTFSLCMLSVLTTADCGAQRIAHNLPPSQRLMEPGPGVGGPGPGVLMPTSAPGGRAGPAPTMMGGGFCPPGMADAGPQGASATSQIAFLGVEGGEVTWDVSGHQMFDSAPLIMPGRQNFPQGAIYRMKLTNLPSRPGVELYPTLEVAPVTPRTDAYLAHAPIPVQFTEEDLDQVLSGNFVTKVIYLPDPEFQELALSGVETLVSTRLDPGVDPITEADRRGSILAILRMGNLDLQVPHQRVGMNDGVRHAQYSDGMGQNGESVAKEHPQESAATQANMEGNYAYEGFPSQPQGMPTTPNPVPPHLVSGMTTPQWGMPHVGTPIGLPGPPHIPLGHEAGLTKHVMKNHTRVRMPPPVHKAKIDVKQRPGLSYPRPVNHVNVSETNRAGFRVFGGTVSPAIPTALKKMTSWLKPGHK